MRSIPLLKYNYILCVNTKITKIVKIIGAVEAYCIVVEGG